MNRSTSIILERLANYRPTFDDAIERRASAPGTCHASVDDLLVEANWDSTPVDPTPGRSRLLVVAIAVLLVGGLGTLLAMRGEDPVVSPAISPELQERPPTYGSSSAVGGYRLDAFELADRGGQAIRIDLTKDGQPLRRFDGEFLHVFLIGEDLGYYSHEVIPTDRAEQWLNNWHNVGDTGQTHVVTMFESADGVIVLGTDVDVTEGSDFSFGPPPSTRSQLLVASGVSVERDGFDFSLAVPWGGDPADGDPAWLTLIRRDDLAVSFNTAELVGDRTFRFNPELPGPGDYLSILEFVPYGYRPNIDYGGQVLGEVGGSAFGFYISIDADRNITNGAEHELVTAVEAFTQAFSDEDHDAGWRLVSARCQQRLGKAEFDIEMNLAAQDPGRRVISIDATVNGDRGTATYATAHGTYTPGEQPYAPQSSEEPWINENGWRWDAC